MKEIFKKYILIVVLGIIITSCGGGGDDGPPPPPPNEAPTTVQQVIFPTANLLCIDNNITFDWEDATDPDGGALRYRIIIATDRDLTQVVENRIVNNSQVTITLPLATAFYWNITTIDNGDLESEPSETLAFFTNREGVSNFAPFTAALIAPEDEGNVATGTVTLSWEGADTNTEDTLTYELFFGTDPDPVSIQTELSVEMFDVMAPDAATTYYWRVNTTDDSGATSIGRVWQFTTN